MFKKQIFKKSFALIIVIIAIVEVSLVVSNFVNFSGKKDKITAQLEDNFGGNASIKGKVYFKLFPVPKFVLTHLRLSEVQSGAFDVNLRAPEVSFHVSPLSFLFGNIDVSDIEIKNAKIDFEIGNNNRGVSSKLGRNFDSINIVDSDLIILNEKYSLVKEFTNFNAMITSSNSKNVDVNVDARFETMLNRYRLVSALDGKQNEEVLINTDIISRPKNNINKVQDIEFKFDIDAKFNTSTADFVSKVMVKGNDIQHFIYNHIYRSSLLFPDETTGDFLTQFDFKFQDGVIKIEEMEVSSEQLTGSFDLAFSSNGEGSANVKILSLSLDSLLSDEDPEYVKYEMGLLGKDDQLVMKLPQNSKFQINIGADELMVDKNKLSDLTAQVTLRGGSDSLFYTDFVHSDVNELELSGRITYDENTENYGVVGQVNSKGENFAKLIKKVNFDYQFADKDVLSNYLFTSKFKIAANIFSFTDINALIDNFRVYGDFVVTNNENNKGGTASEINLNFANLNFDNYHIYDSSGKARHFVDYLYSLIASKEESKTLFQRFIWLRNISSEIKFRLFADNFIYGGIANRNMLVSGNLKHRFFSIDEFSISDQNDNFIASFLVDIGDFPKVHFNLNGDLIDISNFNYIDKEATNSWSKDLFRLPKIADMESSFSINVGKLTERSLEVNDLNIDADIRNGTIYFDNFTGRLFDKGNFKVTGSYIISGLPTMNLGFQVSNLETDKLFYYLFGNNSFVTLASVSGNIYGFGQSPSMFVKQLNSNMKIATSQIVVKNFAIANILQYIANLSKIEVYDSNFDFYESLSSGEVIYNPLATNFVIRKGKAVLNNLQLKTDGINSNIVGKIDITSNQLALTALHAFRAYYLSGKEVENASLRVDYVLRGMFSNLSSSFETSQLKKLISDLRTAYEPIILKRKERNKIIEEQNKEIERLNQEDMLKSEDEKLKMELEQYN